MNNRSTAINPTRISLKPHPLQNALGLTHNSHGSVLHINCLDPYRGSSSTMRFPAVNEKGEKSLPGEMWWASVWRVGEDRGPLWTPSGSTLHSFPAILTWRHNNTLMAVCQPINPSTAQGWAVAMTTVIKPAGRTEVVRTAYTVLYHTELQPSNYILWLLPKGHMNVLYYMWLPCATYKSDIHVGRVYCCNMDIQIMGKHA